MRLTRSLKILCSMAAITLGARECFADYSILIKTLPDEKEATSIKESLESGGYRPVVLWNDAPMHKVLFGKFPNAGEALWVQKKLKQAFPSAQVIATPAAVPIAGDTYDPGERVFSTEVFNRTKGVELTDAAVKANPKAAAILSGIADSRKTSETIMQLQELYNETDPANPLRGWALLRSGYLKLRLNDTKGALEAFHAVSNAPEGVAMKHRLDAMQRTAALYYKRKEYPEAIRAYQDLKSVAESPAIRANCQLEVGGMLLELARQSVGTFDDSIEALRQVRQIVSLDQAPQTYATSELLEAEAVYNKRNVDQALAMFSAIVSKYEGLKAADRYKAQPRAFMRELGAAYFFLGKCHQYKGNHAEAVQIFNRLMGEEFNSKSNFFNIPYRAALELAISNLKLGRNDEALKWRAWIQERYSYADGNRILDVYFN